MNKEWNVVHSLRARVQHVDHIFHCCPEVSTADQAINREVCLRKEDVMLQSETPSILVTIWRSAMGSPSVSETTIGFGRILLYIY
jgi:hypothetical protein